MSTRNLRSMPSKMNDSAVSPVVGTILMVAVTVALGATVLAIMSGFGDEGVDENTNAVFKAQAVNTNNTGGTDAIRLTYISGPSTLGNADVRVAVQNSGGGTLVNSGTTAWIPGDFRIYDQAVAGANSSGSWFVTVSVLGNTIVDTSITLDE